jgi:hypothetical protein
MPKKGRLGQRAAGVDLEAVVQEEFVCDAVGD